MILQKKFFIIKIKIIYKNKFVIIIFHLGYKTFIKLVIT